VRCLYHFLGLAVTLSIAKVILSTLGTALFLAKEGPQELPRFYVLLAVVAILLSAAAGGVFDRQPRIVLAQIAVLGGQLGAAPRRLRFAFVVPAVSN
jgi:nitrate/nitrite transporter NarK